MTFLPPLPIDGLVPGAEWERGEASGVDDAALDALTLDVVRDQPEAMAETHALVVVHQGKIVREAYGHGNDEHSTLISWSISRSQLSLAPYCSTHSRPGRLPVHWD